MYGVTSFTAVINPPQAAILAVGEVEPKPWCATASSSRATRMSVTLVVRPPDPLRRRRRAEFLARVKDILEQPISLAL